MLGVSELCLLEQKINRLISVGNQQPDSIILYIGGFSGFIYWYKCKHVIVAPENIRLDLLQTSWAQTNNSLSSTVNSTGNGIWKKRRGDIRLSDEHRAWYLNKTHFSFINTDSYVLDIAIFCSPLFQYRLKRAFQYACCILVSGEHWAGNKCVPATEDLGTNYRFQRNKVVNKRLILTNKKVDQLWF